MSQASEAADAHREVVNGIIQKTKSHTARRGQMRQSEAVIHPTRRRHQHGVIERVTGRELLDADGNVAAPYRVVDTLELMRRAGTISPEMQAAGVRFRNQFAVACLDTLRAADMERIGGCRGRSISHRIQEAGDEVWDAIRTAGGIAAPGGSVLWHVLGCGQSLNEWAHQRQAWSGQEMSPKAASGVLVTALGILAANSA